MAIISTTGGSGVYTHVASSVYTLFTTPVIGGAVTANTFFIVYLTLIDTSGIGNPAQYNKIIVGPNTPVRQFGENGDTSIWHYVGMEIS